MRKTKSKLETTTYSCIPPAPTCVNLSIRIPVYLIFSITNSSNHSTMALHAISSSSFPSPFCRFSSNRPRYSSLLFPGLAFNGSHWSGAIDLRFGRGRNRQLAVAASTDSDDNVNAEKMRKVVEHICLLKAKQDLSEEDENDMLDYLYTSQYQMPGILAVSLGRISSDNLQSYTHAVFMRFQRKEDVSKFYENPFYLKVLKEHVLPYCHGLMNVEFESEVEDDILPIFRKGEEFNYGVEFVHLIAFDEQAYGIPVEDALGSFKNLTKEFPSLIVQSTQGSNFNLSSHEYTHGIVTRFRSLEAFEMFLGSREYTNMWKLKFEKIIKKALSIHYSVDPVAKEIM